MALLISSMKETENPMVHYLFFIEKNCTRLHKWPGPEIWDSIVREKGRGECVFVNERVREKVCVCM